MLFPTTIVGSFPQPEWLIDRAKLAGRFPPRVRAQELWRIPAAVPRAGAGRRDADRDPRPGGGGPGHRQRRRDPARELLEPLRHRARRRRPRQPGHARSTARAIPNPVPRIVGKIRRKHAVEVEDLKFLRAHTDAHDEDHRARAVHDAAAGAERLLQERGRGGDGLRGRGQRGDQGPVRRRRRRGADRRALHAGAAREGAPVRAAGAEPRARGRAGHDRVHICFGYAAIIHERPSGYSFLPELAQCSCRQVSIETAQSQPRLLGAARSCDGKQIMVGCIDLSDPKVETPEVVAERIERALPHVQARARDPRARLRHEVPAARGGHRQAARRWSRRRRSCAPSTAEPGRDKGATPCCSPSCCSTPRAWPHGASRSARSTRPISAAVAERIAFAGPLLDDAGAMTGSLLVIDFADRAAALAWLRGRAVHPGRRLRHAPGDGVSQPLAAEDRLRRKLRRRRCTTSCCRCGCRASSSAPARCSRCGTRSS